MIKEKIIQEKDSKHEHSETLPRNFSLPLCINQLTPIRLITCLSLRKVISLHKLGSFVNDRTPKAARVETMSHKTLALILHTIVLTLPHSAAIWELKP